MAPIRRLVILAGGDDEQAAQILMSHLDGKPRAQPRLIRDFEYLEKLRPAMAHAARSLPTHRAYIGRHCPDLYSL